MDRTADRPKHHWSSHCAPRCIMPLASLLREHRRLDCLPVCACGAGRKLGFGSHDAPRRDEFLNFVRSSQFSEQTRSEARCFVKHRSKLAAIGTSVISPTKGVDDSGPTSTGGAGAGVSAPSPMNAAAKPSLSEMLSATLASMTRTRVFASPSVFDRVRDQRSPRTVYGIRRRSSPSGHLDLGGWSRSSGVVGDGVSEAKLCTPQARKVSAVRDFYRANGGEF